MTRQEPLAMRELQYVQRVWAPLQREDLYGATRGQNSVEVQKSASTASSYVADVTPRLVYTSPLPAF